MSKRSTKWNNQHDQLLRQLKEEQKGNKKIDWKIISESFNKNFNQNKTPKQCRERFRSYIMVGQDSNQLNWNPQELKILLELYQEHGPCWTIMCPFFNKKSQNTIKNKFNNCLKKAARVIHQQQIQLMSNKRKYKGSITYQLLCKMIKFSNQVHKNLSYNQKDQSNGLLILKFRIDLLKFSLNQNLKVNVELNQLIGLIKTINNKLKSFGHFRQKSKKNLTIKKYSYKTISQIGRQKKCQEQISFGQISTIKPQQQIAHYNQQIPQNEQPIQQIESLFDQKPWYMLSHHSFQEKSLIEQVEQIIGSQRLLTHQKQ